MVKNKKYINMLIPIDNIFGGHEGRLAPMLKFLAISLIPAVLYALYGQILIKLRVFIIFEAIWTVRIALIVLGKEKEKKKFYREVKNNKYASAYDMIRIKQVYDDYPVIEYQNGRIAIAVSSYTKSYMDDDKFAVDYEAFLNMLDDYDCDIYCHSFVDEFKLQNLSENLRIYSDKVFMQERMDLYLEQDNFVAENCQLFKFTFLIKGSKYDWKNMINVIESITKSYASNVFKGLHICSKEEVSEICSRDLGTHISIEGMLRKKYENDEFDNSKVLFYGEEVPKEFSEDNKKDDMDERRVSYSKDDK